MSKFIGSKNKDIIRKYWNKPLIKFLKEFLGKKLFYLGLPSPKAEDIKEWVEYIDEIIAFQCRDYPNPSSPEQTREQVLGLEKELLKYEREGLIKNSLVFDGYIEEVIAQGKDNLNNKFEQDKFITLYNLDFCNSITSPQEVLNKETGKVEKIYKLHTIKKLLETQSTLNKITKTFILLLTIHINFHDSEISRFIKMTDSSSFLKYKSKLKKLKGKELKARLLKSYIFDSIKSYFCHYNFIPEFLPVVLYKGNSQDLLHFTIIGHKEDTMGKGNSLQDPEKFLNQRFITVNNDKLKEYKIDKLKETSIKLESIDALKKSKLFKKYLKK